MADIGVFAYLRVLFFQDNEEFGEKCIVGQPPSPDHPPEKRLPL